MSAPILLILRVLFTVGLYTFLAVALYLLWSDTQRQIKQQANRSPIPVTMLNLTQASVQPVRFYNAEIIVGRDPSCSLRIEDATVSAQHARLSFRHGQWWLEDLQSTNGTFLNQEPVKIALVVASGDVIRFGQAKVSINLERP